MDIQVVLRQVNILKSRITKQGCVFKKKIQEELPIACSPFQVGKVTKFMRLR